MCRRAYRGGLRGWSPDLPSSRERTKITTQWGQISGGIVDPISKSMPPGRRRDPHELVDGACTSRRARESFAAKRCHRQAALRRRSTTAENQAGGKGRRELQNVHLRTDRKSQDPGPQRRRRWGPGQIEEISARFVVVRDPRRRRCYSKKKKHLATVATRSRGFGDASWSRAGGRRPLGQLRASRRPPKTGSSVSKGQGGHPLSTRGPRSRRREAEIEPRRGGNSSQKPAFQAGSRRRATLERDGHPTRPAESKRTPAASRGNS